MKKLWVIVSHPDDEIIWAGNLLINLSRSGWKVYIICLSRATEDRNNQFYQVCKEAGFDAYLSQDLIPSVTQSIGDVTKKINEAKALFQCEGPDLILTHSPYGDEHNHPHHVDCFKQVYKWTKKRKIPLAFFSTIKLPLFHYPTQGNVHQENGYIIAEQGKTYLSPYYFLNSLRGCPRYYITFGFNQNEKKAFFSLYQSVNIQVHIEQYLALSLLQENIYFFCKKGVKLFGNATKSDRPQNILLGFEHLLIRIMRKILGKHSYGH